jgi:DNA-binding winged helix-turn-helix (wHTH) protein/TolB-like protein
MIYTFGTFTFDDEELALTREGRPIKLEPQPAKALTLLLRRSGAVVSREELRAAIWGDGIHIDVDRGLAYCIGQLRAALGDRAENPRFVQTLPRRGFRFIPPVRQSGDIAEPPPADVAAPPGVRIDPGRRRTVAALAIAGVAIGAALAVMVVRYRASARPIVAVAVFENETGDAAHDRLVSVLSDAIVERLTAAAGDRIGVDGNAAILRHGRDARDWRAVAHDTGASFLISGQLQNKPGMLSLLVQLIRLDDGTHVWVRRVAKPGGRDLETLDDDAAALVESAVRTYVLK